jgi:hypothetical protein
MPRTGQGGPELSPGPCERVAYMRQRQPEVSDDVIVYLVLNVHGQFGIAYDETDPASADRETIIRSFLSGQYSNALGAPSTPPRVGPGLCLRTGEALERAFNADDDLGEDTKRFIDRHIAPGEKRPPAP